jgi:DNA-binding transcriptional LysR family regulator
MARHVVEIGTVGPRAAGPVGRFRIASTNTMAEEILSPRAGQFLTKNPGLTLQFLTSSENVNFSRWEADLAVRLRKPDRGDFSISKLADVRLYLFEAADTSEPADGPVVCCYPGDLDLTPESQFLAAKGLQGRARCVTDNIRIIRALIETQAAVGILPQYICEDLLDNDRLRATPLPKRRDVWLLVQNHLKRDHTARIVIDWVRECFAELSRQ